MSPLFGRPVECKVYETIVSEGWFYRVSGLRIDEEERLSMDKDERERQLEFNRAKRDWVSYKGTFHLWGVESTEYDNGAATDTVAIIELDNGRIVTACPTHVVFLNKLDSITSDFQVIVGPFPENICIDGTEIPQPELAVIPEPPQSITALKDFVEHIYPLFEGMEPTFEHYRSIHPYCGAFIGFCESQLSGGIAMKIRNRLRGQSVSWQDIEPEIYKTLRERPGFDQKLLSENDYEFFLHEGAALALEMVWNKYIEEHPIPNIDIAKDPLEFLKKQKNVLG